MATIDKYYGSAFLLDRSKLTRILNIHEDKYANLQLKFKPQFLVKLKDEKIITLTSPDELFALDNTTRNPIAALTIKVVDSSPDVKVESSVSFGSRTYAGGIAIRVSSNRADLARQIFAEIEEQVERTVLNQWIYRTFKNRYFMAFGVTGLMLGIILVATTVVSLLGETSSTNRISRNVGSELLQKYRNASDMEEKVNFLFELNTRQLEFLTTDSPQINLQQLLNFRTLFIVLPLIIILVCAWYAISFCYPSAIFLWGDYEEHYEHLVSIRNVLWIVVILSVILGIITNLFVMGISGFLPMTP